MNNQIGFYFPLITNSPICHSVVKILNDISSKYNTILFNSTYDIIDKSPRQFTTLHCNQSKYFYGTLFTFDINAVSVARSFPAPYKKIFVASEIFWQNKAYPTKTWNDLIMNDIDVITYDSKMYDLYNICFKQPVYNMESGLSSEGFLNVIDSIYSVK